MLINLKSLSPVLVMISNMSVSICNRFTSQPSHPTNPMKFRHKKLVLGAAHI